VWRDSHLVADVRGPAQIARFRHVQVVGDARIIGDDVEELPSALQRADELRAPPLQDANHRAGAGFGVIMAQALGPDIAPDEHAILMQSCAGRALRDCDLLEAGIVRLQKAFALAVHANSSRDQVGLARLDIAMALDACDTPALFQCEQHALQLLLARGRQPQPPEQLGHVCRNVIFAPQQIQNALFHIIHNVVPLGDCSCRPAH